MAKIVNQQQIDRRLKAAHERAAIRHGAVILNHGCVTSDTAWLSKTSIGLLESNIVGDKIVHCWGRDDLPEPEAYTKSRQGGGKADLTIVMGLFTKAIRNQLLRNGKVRINSEVVMSSDHFPVVKLFDPCGAAEWLLTELDPYNQSAAFGLCDLGDGFPVMRHIHIPELTSYRGKFGLGIERDKHFHATKPLIDYASEKRRKQPWWVRHQRS